MTTPTIFSDVAGITTVSRSDLSGAVSAQQAIATIASGSAIGVNTGLIRFDTGFSLTGLAILSTDLDSTDTITLDVGFLYDGTTGEDDNAFLDGLNIAQAANEGSEIWPIADGLLTGVSFIATGPGYLSVTIRDAATNTAGTITAIAEFTYNL